MVSLLEALKIAVKSTEGGAALLLCDQQGGPLIIYQAKKDGDFLPKENIERHWN
ncbi:hypothetical protein TUN199_07768 [Pyrenophora tritici-repentis]|uniref:Uncharacterized protein n=1 Tax=Pyrenophora tritici-repentis TaxID=45151 RepID=A0A5M9LD81_9PLEO|nr:hypothetical protein PtrV1_03685 [Pyrenophora tritici-repentis]KAF7451363.1 hypothetical protein A1F99_031400 [Pyrenophora tritici-repentis]KAF7575531.1 hypothetical protein PtrM4_071550 [Pyrenophora tritici-repentis]KAI0574992.1 hypothetical protein Alg215_08272 [Pyrenophora tritici-repentis]KAI0579640.1 hypothetical protein Alg130_07424 [Pyrenophora tritici-repentis]